MASNWSAGAGQRPAQTDSQGFLGVQRGPSGLAILPNLTPPPGTVIAQLPQEAPAPVAVVATPAPVQPTPVVAPGPVGTPPVTATPTPPVMSAEDFIGTLELTIVEADGLPGNKKLKEDKLQPYVIAHLASNDKEKHTTLAAKAPAYRWGLTVSFVVFGLNDELVMSVKEKQFFSDLHRGTVRVPLRNLVQNMTADMWLPITTSEHKDALLGGRIHVEATLKPAPPDVIANSKNKKKSLVALERSGSAPSGLAVGQIKIEDIGEVSVVAPEGEYPLTADPRGPTPYSYNPKTGLFEIPQTAFHGAFVLDRDLKEM